MPAVMMRRFFFVFNLLNAFIVFLLPKKLRSYLPSSWIPQNIAFNLPPSPPPSVSTVKNQSSPLKMDADELRRAFQLFDKNGDGRITKKEMNESLESMGFFIANSELSQMIERIDANGDGCVDIDEFSGLYGTVFEKPDEDDAMREAFDVFDANGDGFITVDELKSVLTSLGLKQGRRPEDCRMMINKVDMDGDGKVNFTEFKHMMKNGGFASLS